MTTQQLESMEVEVDPTLAVQLQSKSSNSPEAISSAMSTAFTTLGAFLHHHSITPAGPPRAVYTQWDGSETHFTVAFPVAAPPVLDVGSEEKVTLGNLPGGRALRFEHLGPYDTLRETYERIDAWLRDHGAIKSEADWARYMPMWEEYLNDPQTTPAHELRTRIYLPLP